MPNGLETFGNVQEFRTEKEGSLEGRVETVAAMQVCSWKPEAELKFRGKRAGWRVGGLRPWKLVAFPSTLRLLCTYSHFPRRRSGRLKCPS